MADDGNNVVELGLAQNGAESATAALITEKRNCQLLRNALENLKLFDSSKPIQDVGANRVALACFWDDGNVTSLQEWLRQSEPSEWTTAIVEVKLVRFRDKPLPATQREKLKCALKHFVMHRKGLNWTGDFERNIPQSWEKHGDMILLPNGSFQTASWEDIRGEDLWRTIAKALSGKRLALQHPIKCDGFRTPQIELLLGDNGWVTHVDNGISYTFDVTKSMFSAGNITEKLRVAAMDCAGQTVVDMFAGIGYFTLPYLVHAKARLVHACEWNPDALEALRRTLELNHVGDRCVIHEGDNRKVTPVGVAHHVNLGLIPSSEDSWEAACRALDPAAGGVLHVHGNVDSHPRTNGQSEDAVQNDHRCRTVKALLPAWTRWAEEVRQKISELFCKIGCGDWTLSVDQIEHVKRYAPHVDHLVVDLGCIPRLRTM